jgi:3-oxoacyl-[acyl-carrier-protein] synthase-3
MITAGSYKHILVCGADTLSRITNWDDRTTAVLFGDGAGAAVLGPSEHSRMGPFVLGSDGSKVDLLWVPAGGSRRPADETTLAERAHGIRMKGQDVYKNACDRMTEAALAVLGGQPVSSVDLFVAHQANARIVSAVADRLKLTQEQAVCNIAQYGNTSAASIPIALCELEEEGRLKDGMRVLLAAFGAGFSWGAGLVDWGRG